MRLHGMRWAMTTSLLRACVRRRTATSKVQCVDEQLVSRCAFRSGLSWAPRARIGRSTPGAWLSRRCASGDPAAKAYLPRDSSPLLRIVGRDHWVVGSEVPFCPILGGCHLMVSLEVRLQHQDFLAIFQADDEVGLYRRSSRDGRLLWPHRLCFHARATERGVNSADQSGEVDHCDRVIRHVRRDDVRGERQQCF